MHRRHRDLLLRAEGGEIGAGDEMIERLESEDLPARCQQKLFHVLTSDADAASGDACNDLKLLPSAQHRAD